MTEVGSVYGQSLYELCKEEGLGSEVLTQLEALRQSFQEEPAFCGLLASPSLSKAERCQVLDKSFRGSLHPYVLNFLKILTERGYVRHFEDCCRTYENRYNEDNGILPVTAVTALPLTDGQAETLKQKLAKITGKQIKLLRRIDPSVLGGIRLDYADKRLDDTVSHRMGAIRDLLSQTVL